MTFTIQPIGAVSKSRAAFRNLHVTYSGRTELTLNGDFCNIDDVTVQLGFLDIVDGSTNCVVSGYQQLGFLNVAGGALRLRGSDNTVTGSRFASSADVCVFIDSADACVITGSKIDCSAGTPNDVIRVDNTSLRNRVGANTIRAWSAARYGVNFMDANSADNDFRGNNIVGPSLTRTWNDPQKSNLMAETQSMVWSQAGTLSTATGGLRWVPSEIVEILGVTATVGTAPTGSSIIVDVNVNGLSIFTGGARPTIAVSANSSGDVAPDVTQYTSAVTDYVTVDVDQVGSGTAGSDLTVGLRYRTVE